jgi:hypothetical protein
MKLVCMECAAQFERILYPSDVARRKRAGRFCSNLCAIKWVQRTYTSRGYCGPLHPLWKGDDVTAFTKRRRARNAHKATTCEGCGARRSGKLQLDHHHINGDLDDFSKANIAILCRRCHMAADGRLARMGFVIRPPLKRPVPCDACDTLSKPTRHGLCSSCYDYIYRPERRLHAAR